MNILKITHSLNYQDVFDLFKMLSCFIFHGLVNYLPTSQLKMWLRICFTMKNELNFTCRESEKRLLVKRPL